VTVTAPHHAQDLLELRRHWPLAQRPPWRAHLVQLELNGGKTTAAQLDTLAQQPQATALTVSGLENRTLEHLVRRFGPQFTAVHFWKCPRLEDLSPLQDMPQLRYVAFYWNQRAQHLWDFKRTPALRGLHFDDFRKLRRLDALAAATSLDTLVFGNAVWDTFAVETLEPLAALGANLRTLAFSAASVGDGRLGPLASLQGLTSLDFPRSLFSMEQLAWLRARLPATVEAAVLSPHRKLAQPVKRRGVELDVVLSGSPGVLLSSTNDRERLQRREEEFGALVERYAREALPEPVG